MLIGAYAGSMALFDFRNTSKAMVPKRFRSLFPLSSPDFLKTRTRCQIWSNAICEIAIFGQLLVPKVPKILIGKILNLWLISDSSRLHWKEAPDDPDPQRPESSHFGNHRSREWVSVSGWDLALKSFLFIIFTGTIIEKWTNMLQLKYSDIQQLCTMHDL